MKLIHLKKKQEQLKSAYYAYPLVDTKILLSCIGPCTEAELLDDESGTCYRFMSPFTLPSPDEAQEDYHPIFVISKDHVKCTYPHCSKEIPSADFMLVADSGYKLEKAYSIRLQHPIHKADSIAWNGFVNMSKPLMHMQGKFPP